MSMTPSIIRITLYDDVWNVSSGIVRAHIPDRNTSITLAEPIINSVKDALDMVSLQENAHPVSSEGIYVVQRAPMFSGSLFSKRKRFVNKAIIPLFIISSSYVLYVLENYSEGSRLTYDITEYFR